MPNAGGFDCGRCTSWLPPARGGIQVPGTRSSPMASPCSRPLSLSASSSWSTSSICVQSPVLDKQPDAQWRIRSVREPHHRYIEGVLLCGSQSPVLTGSWTRHGAYGLFFFLTFSIDKLSYIDLGHDTSSVHHVLLFRDCCDQLGGQF